MATTDDGVLGLWLPVDAYRPPVTLTAAVIGISIALAAVAIPLAERATAQVPGGPVMTYCARCGQWFPGGSHSCPYGRPRSSTPRSGGGSDSVSRGPAQPQLPEWRRKALAAYQAGLEKWRQGDMDGAITSLSGAQSWDPNDEAIRRDLTRFRKERECVWQAGPLVAEADHAGETGDWEKAFRIYEWVLQALTHKDTDFAARVRTKLAAARPHLPWKTDEERADLERGRRQAREDAEWREREAARMEENRRYWERVNREAEQDNQERRERLAKMLDDGAALLKLSGSSSGSEGVGELSFDRPSGGSQAATEPKLQFPPIEAPRRLFEPGDQNSSPVVAFGPWPNRLDVVPIDEARDSMLPEVIETLALRSTAEGSHALGLGPSPAAFRERFMNPYDAEQIARERELLRPVDKAALVRLDEKAAAAFALARQEAAVNESVRRTSQRVAEEFARLQREGVIREGENILKRQREDPAFAKNLSGILQAAIDDDTRRRHAARQDALHLLAEYYRSQAETKLNAEIDRARDQILAEEAAELNAARHRAYRDGRAYADEIKRAGLLDGLAGYDSLAEREQADPKFAALMRPLDAIRERWEREEAAIYAHSLEKMMAAVARLRQAQGQP